MCGLVGIAGHLKFQDEASMKKLLLLDVLRGHDSTGLAAIRASGDVKVAKLASHPLDLLEMPKFKDALNGTASRAFIGHNRAATRGVVNTYNAHPFHCGNIVGAHNGTLDTESTRALEEAVGEKFTVDSHAIFAAIDKIGVTDTVGLMREGATGSDGAWSLTWYDGNDGTLNFLRNKHRPMWYAYTKDFDRMFWASEWHMIDYAMASGGYDLFRDGDGHGFFQTETDIHYRYDLTDFKPGGTERPKPVAKTLKGKAPKTAGYTGGTGTGPFGRDGAAPTNGSGGNTVGKTNSTPSTCHVPSESKNKKNILHLVGNNRYPFAGIVSVQEFTEMAKAGCDWCRNPVDPILPGVTIFEKDAIVMCPACSKTAGSLEPTTQIFIANMDNYV